MKWSRFQHEPAGDRMARATAAIGVAKINRQSIDAMQRIVSVAHQALQQTPVADAIIGEECRRAGVTWLDLLNRSRTGRLQRRHCDTRHAIFAKLIDIGLSTPEIARLFATNHTTVLKVIGGTDDPVRPAKR